MLSEHGDPEQKWKENAAQEADSGSSRAQKRTLDRGVTRAWTQSATRLRHAPGAEAMSPTSLSSTHVHTPDATTSCRCESCSCRPKWKPLVRCGGGPSRKWLITIHRPASSNVSFPLTRRSLRSFRLYSRGFEGFGETAGRLCRPPHTWRRSTERRSDKPPTAERHTAKHCAYSPSADPRTMEPETGSVAVTLTEGRLTFAEEDLGDPRWYTRVGFWLKRRVKWEWRLSIRSADWNDEIVSSSGSEGALATAWAQGPCVCSTPAENIYTFSAG